jgi:hypothetical protein
VNVVNYFSHKQSRMGKRGMNQQQYRRAVELRALGARGDDEVLERARAEHEGFLLSPVTRACRIYEAWGVPERGTAFEARVRATNQTASVMQLRDYRIFLPWTRIELLQTPSGGFYRSFDEHPRPIDESAVLNGMFLHNGKLFPGEEREGSILGYGADSIPTEFGRGQEVPVTLWIQDSRNKHYKFDFVMKVFRQKALTRPSHCRVRREPLFGDRDPNASGDKRMLKRGGLKGRTRQLSQSSGPDEASARDDGAIEV